MQDDRPRPVVHTGDRPAGWVDQTRSVVMARNGAVATSQPLAAQAGLRILLQGGNAVDAAVATAAALNVVEPMSTGIGGDMFAIVYLAESGELLGINGSGRAPAGATLEEMRSRGFEAMPRTGILSTSVPGTVDGWDQVLKRAGTMSLSQVLQPAIEYAQEGFAVSEVVSWQWESLVPKLSTDEDSVRTWLVDGHAPRPGTLFRNPGLGRSLRRIAEEGRDGFYAGEVAREIEAKSRALGGLLTAADLASHTSTWVDPVSTSYRGHEIYELPPNGQGIAALEMLNILEDYDLAGLGRESVEYWHLLIEAKKLAYADLTAHLADPAFYPVPVEEILSKEHAARQRGRIDLRRASTEFRSAIPVVDRMVHAMEEGDTVYIVTADRWGNMVSFINSLFNGFGSGVTAGETGIALQNRGGLFSLDPRHPNRIEPGKRPYHTIIPAFAMRDGRPWLAFGVMGGDQQAQGHAQVIVNMVDFGMNVQAAGDAARFHHSQTANAVGIEGALGRSVSEGLRGLGHEVVQETGTFGGYQAIALDEASGVLQAGSDPRKDGQAVGY
jgi:gamma-glutamyltranspeptidase / glutathione hydrolase